MTMKLNTPRAVDWPIFDSIKANLYANVVVVSVSYPGPPRVITQIIGNELNTLIKLIMVAINSEFLSSGNLILRYICQAVAPSTEAASIMSGGIDCNPTSQTNEVKGTETKTATHIKK